MMALIFRIFVNLSLIFTHCSALEDTFENDGTTVEMVANVREFGALGNGKSLETDQIQETIDWVSSNGGGLVIIPKGTYLIRTIFMKSHVTLLLREGSVLLGSKKLEDWAGEFEFELSPKCGGNHSMTLLGGPMIFCLGCQDIAIRGKGTIDGQGHHWWAKSTESMKNTKKGYMIYFLESKNVYIQGITIRNSPGWTLVPKFCTDVLIEQISIENDIINGKNTDGINPYSSNNVLIRDSTIQSGDDCIAVKSGPSRKCGHLAEKIIVQNITCIGSHGLSIGSEMGGGVRDISFLNIKIDGKESKSSCGVRIKSQRGRAGFVENVLYENITITNVKIAIQITMNYHHITDKSLRLPCFRNIKLNNVHANKVWYKLGHIDGIDDGPIEGIILNNISMTGKGKFTCTNVLGFSYNNTTPLPFFFDNSCVKELAYDI